MRMLLLDAEATPCVFTKRFTGVASYTTTSDARNANGQNLTPGRGWSCF